jgi:hypothetical protein
VEKLSKKGAQGNNNMLSDVEGLGKIVKEVENACAQAGTPDGDQKLKSALENLDMSAKVFAAGIDSEMGTANGQFRDESGNQAVIFSQVGQSVTVLNGTSELTSLGLSTESLATRLFTVSSVKDVDALQSSLTGNFDKINRTAKGLDKTLGALGAKQEQRTLATAMAGVGSMKGLLFSGDGIVAKVRNQLLMKEKAARSMEKLRSLVLAEAQEAKKTMATAKGVQEQSIIDVNRMIPQTSASIARSRNRQDSEGRWRKAVFK